MFLRACAEVSLGVDECHDHFLLMPAPARRRQAPAATWALWLQQGSGIVPDHGPLIHFSSSRGGCLSSLLAYASRVCGEVTCHTAISGENFHRSLPLQHMCFRLANESLSHTLQALFKLLFSFFSCVSGWVRQQGVSHLEGKQDS